MTCHMFSSKPGPVSSLSLLAPLPTPDLSLSTQALLLKHAFLQKLVADLQSGLEKSQTEASFTFPPAAKVHFYSLTYYILGQTVLADANAKLFVKNIRFLLRYTFKCALIKAWLPTKAYTEYMCFIGLILAVSQ